QSLQNFPFSWNASQLVVGEASSPLFGRRATPPNGQVRTEAERSFSHRLPEVGAEIVARTIVRLSVHPRREVFVGRSGRLLNLSNIIAPAISERLMRISVERSHFEKGKRAESTTGNLYKP